MKIETQVIVENNNPSAMIGINDLIREGWNMCKISHVSDNYYTVYLNREL